MNPGSPDFLASPCPRLLCHWYRKLTPGFSIPGTVTGRFLGRVRVASMDGAFYKTCFQSQIHLSSWEAPVLQMGKLRLRGRKGPSWPDLANSGPLTRLLPPQIRSCSVSSNSGRRPRTSGAQRRKPKPSCSSISPFTRGLPGDQQAPPKSLPLGP